MLLQYSDELREIVTVDKFNLAYYTDPLTGEIKLQINLTLQQNLGDLDEASS